MHYNLLYFAQLIIILLNLKNKRGEKGMDRDIPCFNRPIIEKIQRKNQQRHLERLRNIKSGSSNRTMPVSSNNHALSNKKGVMAEQEKKCEIQKQNVLLFNKMMRIMKRNDPHNQPNRTQMSRVNKTAAFEVSRINEENKNLFQRLQQQRPTISNKKFQEDRLKNLNILRFLGKYPNPVANRTSYDTNGSIQIGRQSETKRKYDSYQHRDQNLRQFQLDQSLYDKQLKNYQQQVQKLKQKSLQVSGGRRKFMSQAVQRNNNKIESQQSERTYKLETAQVIVENPNNYRVQERQKSKTSAKSQYNQNGENGHPKKQITLYQKKCMIGKHTATVHFIRLYNIYKIRAIFDQKVQGQQVYEMQIPEQQGNQFFSEQSYDYGKICRMLLIEDGYLVVNPNLETSQSAREMMQPKSSEKMMVKSNKKIASTPMDDSENPQWAKYEEALEESID